MAEKTAPSDRARVILRGGFPFCSACWRRIGKPDQWRCPYTSCRRWFRSEADDPTPARPGQGPSHASWAGFVTFSPFDPPELADEPASSFWDLWPAGLDLGEGMPVWAAVEAVAPLG